MNFYKVHRKDVQVGLKVEMKEHPTMGKATATRTVRQHLERHPMYYQLEPAFDRMLTNREKNIKPLPPRPKPAPVNNTDIFFL